MKMHLKMSSAKWGPFCLGLNVLRFHLSRLPIPSITRHDLETLSALHRPLDHWPEQLNVQVVELSVVWEAIKLTRRHWNDFRPLETTNTIT